MAQKRLGLSLARIGVGHEGRSDDARRGLAREVDGLPAIAVAGYSLGGNLTLKLAGELGRDAPKELRAVCAISPTMDL